MPEFAIGTDCPVCKEPLPSLAKCAFWSDACRHRMHRACMTSWKRTNTNCPVLECKYTVIPERQFWTPCNKIILVMACLAIPGWILLAFDVWRTLHGRTVAEPNNSLCDWICDDPSSTTSGALDTFRFCAAKCKQDDPLILVSDEWSANFARAVTGPAMHTEFHPKTCPLYHGPGCYHGCYAACGRHTNNKWCRHDCAIMCCETLDFEQPGSGQHWTSAFGYETIRSKLAHRPTSYDPAKEAACENTCEYFEDFSHCNAIAQCSRQCYLDG